MLDISSRNWFISYFERRNRVSSYCKRSAWILTTVRTSKWLRCLISEKPYKSLKIEKRESE